MIGLDSKLLSDAERLNADEMYRIYQGEMPDTEDGLDDVAANQRAIALLQRIQEHDPDLWATITNLPDGIRSALIVNAPQRTGAAPDETQMPPTPQMPLISPSRLDDTPAPFDDPGPGETIVLLAEGDFKGCYAVGTDKNGVPSPRQISPAQFIAAAECAPGAPAQPLPSGTNERVMAAFEAFRTDLSRRLGRARRRPDSRARRYVSRQLNIARNAAAPSEVPRIETLRRIFRGDLSPQVESALAEIRSMKIEGNVLTRRLEALRERYRLNPPDAAGDTGAPEPQVIRIVCSDGLV